MMRSVDTIAYFCDVCEKRLNGAYSILVDANTNTSYDVCLGSCESSCRALIKVRNEVLRG